jgi:hypothetical protein
MVMRSRAWVAAVATAALCGSATAGGQAPPPVDELLRRAADYIDEYERQFSGVVSEEHYVQVSSNAMGNRPITRRLRSDMLLIRTNPNGWMGFRDVFEVDGKAVRDRNERLYKLFLTPGADAMVQARAIVEESTRFNLGAQDGTLIRTINLPTLALAFLRREHQDRLKFEADGTRKIADTRAVQLKYAEQVLPRLITTRDSAPASGRFSIDPVSGRVVQSKLVFRSAGTDATIEVVYASRPGVDVWVPISMVESYRLKGGLTIDGRATYSNFRKFTVAVDTVIK